MPYSKLRLKFVVYAILFCTVAAANAAQDKTETQSAPSVGATTTARSDTTQFEVAPGLPLPVYGMVWILDQAENKPQLARVYLNSAHVNGHRAENFVRAQFLVLKMDATIELPGTAAKLRINSHAPAIFVRKSEEEEEELQSAANAKNVQAHYVLLRLRVAGDHRVVTSFSAWQLGLKPSRHEDVVDALTEEVAAGQWLKITPRQALPDGEYALVHMPDDKKLFEPHAYDFGIGAAAAQTANH